MNETVQKLVDAIRTGDALATEQAFNAAMAEKLSTKIDEYRQQVAAGMFNQEEAVTEDTEVISLEEYEALSEEEKAEYELVEASVFGAMKTVMKNKGLAGDTHGRYDTPRATQAAAKRKVVAAKKVIKKAGGDYKKVADRADKKTERENEMFY